MCEPQVSVIVTSSASYDFRSRSVVTGAVGKPISLAYTEGMNVLDGAQCGWSLNDLPTATARCFYRQYEGQTVVIPGEGRRPAQKGMMFRPTLTLLPVTS